MQLSPSSAQSAPSPGLTDTSAIDQYLDLDSFLDQSPSSASPAGTTPLFADAFNTLGRPSDPSALDASELFKMYLANDQDKQPFAISDFSAAPSATFSAAASSAFGTDSLSAPVINPQLVQTPSPLAMPPAFESIQEEHESDAQMDEDEEDEEDEEEVKPKRRPASRKKAAPKSSVASLAMPIDPHKPNNTGTNGKLPHIAFPVPDYVDRPSEDVYKKMNSKEKRQLRNKISARNFRHRRKEYITTLEEEIASRDGMITGLRAEMGALQHENGELKRDVSLLKKQFEEAMAKIGGIAPAASSSTASCSPSTSVSPLATSTNSDPPAVRRATRSLAMPNLSKDVMPGSSSWGPGGFGGITRNLGVHHTILPEDRFSLSGKPRNLNPLLDSLDPLKLAQGTAHMRDPTHSYGLHDDLCDTNPYMLQGAAAEAYRGQLYSKLGHNKAGLDQGGRNANGEQTFPFGFRPAYFNNSSSLSGKPSPDDLIEREQAAYVAGHATTTLFGRMAAAFAEAFAGPSGGTKVADVLAGRARVQVVPEADLADRLASLRVGGERSCSTLALNGLREEERPTSPTV